MTTPEPQARSRDEAVPAAVSRPPTAADTPARQTGVSVRGTAIVAVGMTVSQALALGQMLVISRVLGPSEFGVFGSLAVFLLLGSTAQAATQVVVARHMALREHGSPESMDGRVVAVVGVITMSVAAAITPLLAAFLDFDSIVALLAISATLLPLTFIGAQLGQLQGREEYNRLGGLYVVATAGRVFFAIAAAIIWDTATAAALGVLVGSTAAYAVGAILTRDASDADLPPSGGAVPARVVGATRRAVVEIGHAGHALIALYALTNVDVLLARSQLSPHDAGLYAAGQLVARSVFFLPQAILVAAFPRMVAQGGGRAQRQATAAVAAIGLLAALGTAVLPGLVLAVIAGAQYVEVTSSLWIFALAGAGFGVVQVLLYARLAQHDRRAALLMWTGTAALVGLGLTVGPGGVAPMAACAAVVAWAVALVGLILDARSHVAEPSAG